MPVPSYSWCSEGMDGYLGGAQRSHPISPPPERLVQGWHAVGLPLQPPASSACHFCQRPLHFALMSEWERDSFGSLGAQCVTSTA